MAHRLNTNKQFMLGNGLLAFAVLIVVIIFVYISMRAQREKIAEGRYYTEKYTINLANGFINDSLTIYINDSVLVNKRITEEPYILEVERFADQSALLIVDNKTDLVATFDLSERGGNLSFTKDAEGIKQLSK